MTIYMYEACENFTKIKAFFINWVNDDGDFRPLRIYSFQFAI